MSPRLPRALRQVAGFAHLLCPCFSVGSATPAVLRRDELLEETLGSYPGSSIAVAQGRFSGWLLNYSLLAMFLLHSRTPGPHASGRRGLDFSHFTLIQKQPAGQSEHVCSGLAGEQ